MPYSPSSNAEAVCTIILWKNKSNGFSKRDSVNCENPRPSTRITTQAPGNKRREWKYSNERICFSNPSLFISHLLLDPRTNLKSTVVCNLHVEKLVEANNKRETNKRLDCGVHPHVWHSSFPCALLIALKAMA